MIRQMDESAFAAFVAALWAKQGWQTRVTQKKGQSFVALQREGAESLIWVSPSTGDPVSGKELQQFAKLCQQYGLDEGAVVTAGSFSGDAKRIAGSAGVELVDGEKLRTIVEARELHDLVREHVDASESDAGEDGGDGDEESGFSILDVPTKATASVVVALLAVVVAAFVAPTILGTGGQVQEKAFEVTSPESPGNATAPLQVRWNAKTTTEIDPSSKKNVVYPSRSGQQFVVVRMNVTNEANDTVLLRQKGFQFRANGTIHGYQPLGDEGGFGTVQLAPGQSTTVWTAFSVGEGTTGGALVVNDAVHGNVTRERADDVAVNFTHDPKLSADI